MASEFPLPQEPRLTVALVVRDAEDLLSLTLDSVRFIADEILVVDTGSTDRTRAIAVEAQAKVMSLLWNDDFSAPRNLAMAHATGDWILWLDAGETLSADAAQGIKLFLREQANNQTAYMLMVSVAPEYPAGSREQVGRIRLIPNFHALRFEGRIRERIHESLTANNLQLATLPWAIERSAHEHDQLVRSRKARRDLRLAELEMKNVGWTARMLNLMGDAYSRLGDTTAALDYYKRALQYAQRSSVDMLEAYYGLLAGMDALPNVQGEQLSICLQALEFFSFDAQLLCAMGSYLQKQNRIELAARAYQSAAEYGQVELELWHLGDIQEIAYVCWSMCLQLIEKDDEAIGVLEQALAREGSSTRLRRQLIELYVKRDRRKEALDQVNLLPPETPHREALRTAVRGACLAAKQSWPAALGYLQTAFNAGCREPVALRWYAVTLLALGDFAAAEPILQAWRDVEPRNPELLQYLAVVDAQMPASADGGSVPPLPALNDADRKFRVDPQTPTGGEKPTPNLPGLGGPTPSRSMPFSRRET